MKKLLLVFVAAAMAMVGCTKESTTGFTGKQTVTFSVAAGDATTKADPHVTAIPAEINRCIAVVRMYAADNTTLLDAIYAKPTCTKDGQSYKFSVDLMGGQTYEITVWLDHEGVYTVSEKLDQIERTNKYLRNLKELDAFSASVKYVAGEATPLIVATRPFAQLNLITRDLVEGFEPSIKLKYTAPKYFNAITAEVSGEQEYVTEATSYAGEYAYAPQECHLTSDYIFAGEEKSLVSVEMTATKTSDFVRTFDNLPLQRNYKTNVKGKLLTVGADFTVQVDADWSGNHDVAWVSVSTPAAVAAAIEAGATNVSVEEVPASSGTADVPEIKIPKTDNEIGIKLPESNSNPVKIVYKEASETQGQAPILNVNAQNNTAPVEIVAPQSHVVLDGEPVASGQYHFVHVIASTSTSTLVIPAGIKVNKLTVITGGIEIHGSVDEAEIDEQAHDVIVRECEGLTQSVYAVLKDYIASGYIAVKNADDTYDIVSADARGLAYRTDGIYKKLPAAPVKSGAVWNVTAANAQYVLDGAYGSIDGKTINFTESVLEKLVLGRPSKYEGSNTEYRHGKFDNEPMSYDDFIAYKSQTEWTEYCYYNRTVENVTFTSNQGVKLAGFEACGGAHVSGTAAAPVYDYVRDNGVWCPDTNNGYMVYVILRGFKFNGLEFTAKTDIDTSSDLTVFDGFEFKDCKFNMGGTAGNAYQAIRYYSEGTKGNVKNLAVKDCEFYNVNQAVYVNKVVNVTLESNKIDTTGHNAFAIQNSKETDPALGTVIIKDNIITGCGDRAIRFNYVNAPSSITITGNSATYAGEANTEDAIKATKIAEGVEIIVADNNWNNYKDPYNPEFCVPVAKIGTKGYTKLSDAFGAVSSGETISVVKAGTYPIPGSGIADVPTKVKVVGCAGVVFDCKGTGNIAKIANGISFEGITFEMGQTEYHGFQHSGPLSYKNCTINGYYKTYGKTVFEDCVFNQDTYAYSLHAYGTDLTVKNCTFNNKGKAFYCYNEGSNYYDVDFEGCTFNVTYGTKAKPQIFVKNNYANQKYTVNIKDCKIGESNKTVEEYRELDVDPDNTNGKGDFRLWNVEVGSAKGAKVIVTLDGETVYEYIEQ